MWSIIVGNPDDLEIVEVMVANTQIAYGVYLDESDPLYARLVKLGDDLITRAQENS